MHEAVLGKQLFAVDGPDGEHDLEDVVSLVVFVDCLALLFLSRHLSQTLVTKLKQEEHLAGVHRIINTASVLEDPEVIKKEHQLEEEIRRRAVERSFDNAKY